MILIRILFLLIAFPATCHALASYYDDLFSKNHVERIYSGPVAEINFDADPRAERFRRVITQEAKKGPNFSGSYRLIEWGGGTNCTQIVIVNLETGDIHDWVETCGASEFRLDASLLIVNPVFPDDQTEYPQYPPGCVTELYYLNPK